MPQFQLNGYTVEFPYEPYQAQRDFMEKVIKALDKPHTHACKDDNFALIFFKVLESPTGTGKTLSLICAALAWQKGYKEQIVAEWRSKFVQASQATKPTHAKKTADLLNKAADDLPVVTPSSVTNMDALLPILTGGVGTTLTPAQEKQAHKIINWINLGLMDKVDHEIAQQYQLLHATKNKVSTFWLPKIFYCSRTHSQLKQVISEFKKTSYRPQMALLGSRDHYCIHPTVSKNAGKNEECRNLIDRSACGYHKNAPDLATSKKLQPSGELEIFDIEDLVKFGKEKNACPYYASRHMFESAEIVFCPYNYLLDPSMFNLVIHTSF